LDDNASKVSLVNFSAALDISDSDTLNRVLKEDLFDAFRVAKKDSQALELLVFA
jgi:hypothetical protein